MERYYLFHPSYCSVALLLPHPEFLFGALSAIHKLRHCSKAEPVFSHFIFSSFFSGPLGSLMP